MDLNYEQMYSIYFMIVWILRPSIQIWPEYNSTVLLTALIEHVVCDNTLDSPEIFSVQKSATLRNRSLTPRLIIPCYRARALYSPHGFKIPRSALKNTSVFMRTLINIYHLINKIIRHALNYEYFFYFLLFILLMI